MRPAAYAVTTEQGARAAVENSPGGRSIIKTWGTTGGTIRSSLQPLSRHHRRGHRRTLRVAVHETDPEDARPLRSGRHLAPMVSDVVKSWWRCSNSIRTPGMTALADRDGSGTRRGQSTTPVVIETVSLRKSGDCRIAWQSRRWKRSSAGDRMASVGAARPTHAAGVRIGAGNAAEDRPRAVHRMDDAPRIGEHGAPA